MTTGVLTFDDNIRTLFSTTIYRVPKNWSKGLTKATDPRVPKIAEAHRGLQYKKRFVIDRREGSTARLDTLSWSPELAYALGLAATDGCLVNTGRHVAFVSSDLDIGDVELYRWLSAVGLTERKSLTLAGLAIPDHLLLHAVRGLLDGDGSIAHYVHRPVARRYPHYLYRRFCVRFHSASLDHLLWLQGRLKAKLSIDGAILMQTKDRPHNMYELKYGKYASITLLTKLYEDPSSPRLLRKWLKWEDFKAQPVTTRPYRRRRP